ncbi:MAG: ROK family protein [Clostridia bacterium]|nr:ROK family protein [Clostridia bacterium]
MKIGIDLGGSHIAIGVVNDKGEILNKKETKLSDVKIEEKKSRIQNYILENVQELVKKYEISSIGIAIPGTVSSTTIIKSVNLGIQDYNIVDYLKEKLELPILIRNDAKCAAIAEDTYGCLKGYKRALFLTLGTGIGAAIIINGKLLDTGDLPGCEAGHMVIQKDGLLCNCGKRGCFEKYASMKSFKDSLRSNLPYREYQTGKMLKDLLKEKTDDEQLNLKIDKTVEEYIEYLALGISNLINIFEPEVIGIGGSFVHFADILLPKLKQKLLDDNMLFNYRDDIEIRVAKLGNDAGIIGAVN